MKKELAYLKRNKTILSSTLYFYFGEKFMFRKKIFFPRGEKLRKFPNIPYERIEIFCESNVFSGTYFTKLTEFFE